MGSLMLLKNRTHKMHKISYLLKIFNSFISYKRFLIRLFPNSLYYICCIIRRLGSKASKVLSEIIYLKIYRYNFRKVSIIQIGCISIGLF